MFWVSSLPSTEMEEGVGEGDGHLFFYEKKSENTIYWCRWWAARTPVCSRRTRELGSLQNAGDFYSGWVHTSLTQQFHPQVFVCVWRTHDSAVKNLPANAGEARDMGSIRRLGRCPGEGNDNPLQYSCLGNPMDRGAWWATVHGVAKELDTT